jgi:hypothetical protein
MLRTSTLAEPKRPEPRVQLFLFRSQPARRLNALNLAMLRPHFHRLGLLCHQDPVGAQRPLTVPR